VRQFYASIRGAGWLRPSLADLLLVSLVGWLFVSGQGWSALLADGDAGWHIRAGDWMLQHRTVPISDIFSFSRSGAPWFAWEWLSDVVFSLLHRAWGLAGVTVLSGCVIALTALALLGDMLRRGASALVSLAVLLLSLGAISIHFLARPHVFTLLLLVVALRMVERDRRQPGAAVWLLIPLSVLWVNLHGGFFALPASLAALAVGTALEAFLEPERRATGWRRSRRLGALAGGVMAASLVNPYGIGLHRHVAGYLTSDWIRNAVEEFQAPKFRSENLLYFEGLLLAALLLAGALAARRRWADTLLILLWGHLALGSVRHVPVFAIVAAPLVAVESSRLWERWASRQPSRSAGRILCGLGEDLRPSFQRLSPWSVVLAAAAIGLTPGSRWPRDFPEAKFPVALLRAESSHLAGLRVFTPDQWGDYLIYSGWPRQRVFIDGRSDFYGPSLGEEYLRLVEGRPGWEQLFQKYDFGAVLIPRSWPLEALLDRDPGWQRRKADALAVLFQRAREPSLAPPNEIARRGR